jgi:uncharacterized protein (TIGR00290 family)
MRLRLALSWSSGKDAAWALHRLRRDPGVEVVGLLTTVNETAGRVAMHAVPESLLQAQAAAVGLPLWRIPLPWPCPDGVYEARMAAALEFLRTEGVQGVAYGDLFLEDIRAYREARHAGTGLSCHFPLWGCDTATLARDMTGAGLRATLVAVDTARLEARFAGRAFDPDLLAELPATVDPCGEHGEFHTFAWDGPMFDRPVPVSVGPTLVRDGIAFADLRAAEGPGRLCDNAQGASKHA